MPAPGQALPGRSQPIPTAARHFINGRPLRGPYPAGLETAHARVPKASSCDCEQRRRPGEEAPPLNLEVALGGQ